MRNLIPLLILLAVAGCAKPGGGWTGNAQDFSFKNFGTGQEMRLSSYAGKPVVLNFWADW